MSAIYLKADEWQVVSEEHRIFRLEN